jgi:hypothetical protein
MPRRVAIKQSSPPQLRRGEPRRSQGWGGVGQGNQLFDQHHPGASRHPSSAEEGSFLAKIVHLAALCVLAVSFAHVASAQEIANIAGKWDVTVRIAGQNVSEQWTIQQDGGDFKATIKGPNGELKVTGEVNSIAFRSDFKDSGGMDNKVRASVFGDVMNGSITIGKKEYLWSAKRSKS